MPDKRRYRMTARAVAANRTQERVLDAAVECFGARPYAEVTLQDISKQAGVGLQTVVRVGKSKEDLFAKAAERLVTGVAGDLGTIPASCPEAALDFLTDVYEGWGDRMMRVLGQEDQIPAIKKLADQNRMLQHRWLESLFGNELDRLPKTERKRRLVSLMTVTGARTWYVLRRVHRLSKSQAAEAIREMVDGLMDLPLNPSATQSGH